MSTRDFLLEIGCEELPPTTLHSLSTALVTNIQKQLNQLGLTYKDIQPFATPRRLTVLVNALTESQPPHHIERQGPSLKAAYDKNGTPTLACLGFARSCGVSAEDR